MNLIVVGSIASLIAGLATGIGALPVLFVKTLTDRLQGIFWALAVGLCWPPLPFP